MIPWGLIVRAVVAEGVDWLAQRRAAAQRTEKHVRGPSAVLITCIRCGARVPADGASIAAHQATHRSAAGRD